LNLRPQRLGLAELLIATGAVGLIVILFAVQWYEVTPQFRDSPALPVVAVVVLLPIAILTVLVLLVRVFIDTPDLQLANGASSALQTRPGAYAGFAFALVLAVGAWFSLRRDSVDAGDSPAAIELFPLESARRRDLS